jgi:hypothetical protein
VPVFFISVCCEFLLVVGAPSDTKWLVHDNHDCAQVISLVFSVPFARASAPGRSGVDWYELEVTCIFRSLELPLLLGCSVEFEFSELSDRCALCDDFGALRFPKKDFDASRVCLESLGEGKY